MAIVKPFWKSLASAIQILPSFGPLKQWLISNWAKTGQECNFFGYEYFNFSSMDKRFPQKVYWAPEEKLGEMDLEHWNFAHKS